MHLFFIKKKRWFALTAVLFLSAVLKAQDSKTQLRLDRMEYPVETIYLQEKGFLILTEFLGKNKDRGLSTTMRKTINSGKGLLKISMGNPGR